jgi:hypothetical protein
VERLVEVVGKAGDVPRDGEVQLVAMHVLHRFNKKRISAHVSYNADLHQNLLH